MRLNLLSILAALAMVACGDKSEDDTWSGGDADADTDADGGIDGDGDGDADADGGIDDTGGPGTSGFTVNGTASHAVSREPVAAGLCVSVADPTPALLGGALEALAEGVTGDGGSFSLTDIVTTSTLGLVVVITDCPDSDISVYPSATGLSSSQYSELGDGDVIDGFQAWSFTLETVGAVDVGLTTAGHVDFDGNPATFSASGGLVGWIFDAENSPAPDAQISCAAGYCPAFYATSQPFTDPNFLMDGDTKATSTSDLGSFFLPGAPITTYTTTHPSLSFDTSTLGSLPGMVLFVSIFSEDVLDPLDADGGGDDTGAGDDTGSSDTGGEDTPLVTDGS